MSLNKIPPPCHDILLLIIITIYPAQTSGASRDEGGASLRQTRAGSEIALVHVSLDSLGCDSARRTRSLNQVSNFRGLGLLVCSINRASVRCTDNTDVLATEYNIQVIAPSCMCKPVLSRRRYALPIQVAAQVRSDGVHLERRYQLAAAGIDGL